MPNWDEDSPRLRTNFAQILKVIYHAAERRETPTLETSKRWHQIIMSGLSVPDPRLVGSFRGEPGLEHLQARVGPRLAVSSESVAEELTEFEKKTQKLVSYLDAMVPLGEKPTRDQLSAILDISAWIHSEWIRIHPFANGNGRIARIWANSIAMRYGLPHFLSFRPRPGIGYVEASMKAMQGDWKPTAIAFRQMLDDFLKHH